MKVSVLISTYGDDSWRQLALERALPSAEQIGAHEILVHHEPDGNVATFRNNNAARATGDYLLMLDADDTLSENYLLAMGAALGQHTSRNGRPVLLTPATARVNKNRLPSRGSVLKEADLRYSNWLIIGTLTPRSLFEELGGFRDWPHGLEDWDYWTRAEKRGVEILKVPQATYYAHWSKDSQHRQLWRQRGQQVYWHNCVGHDVWPEIYAAPTEEEHAAQSMTAIRYANGAPKRRGGCGCRGGR